MLPSQFEVLRLIGRLESALGPLRVPRVTLEAWRRQARRWAHIARWERN